MSATIKILAVITVASLAVPLSAHAGQTRYTYLTGEAGDVSFPGDNGLNDGSADTPLGPVAAWGPFDYAPAPAGAESDGQRRLAGVFPVLLTARAVMWDQDRSDSRYLFLILRRSQGMVQPFEVPGEELHLEGVVCSPASCQARANTDFSSIEFVDDSAKPSLRYEDVELGHVEVDWVPSGIPEPRLEYGSSWNISHPDGARQGGSMTLQKGLPDSRIQRLSVEARSARFSSLIEESSAAGIVRATNVAASITWDWGTS